MATSTPPGDADQLNGSEHRRRERTAAIRGRCRRSDSGQMRMPGQAVLGGRFQASARAAHGWSRCRLSAPPGHALRRARRCQRRLLRRSAARAGRASCRTRLEADARTFQSAGGVTGVPVAPRCLGKAVTAHTSCRLLQSIRIVSSRQVVARRRELVATCLWVESAHGS